MRALITSKLHATCLHAVWALVYSLFNCIAARLTFPVSSSVFLRILAFHNCPASGALTEMSGGNELSEERREGRKK